MLADLDQQLVQDDEEGAGGLSGLGGSGEQSGPQGGFPAGGFPEGFQPPSGASR